MKKVLILFSLPIFLFSCNSGLSKSEAEKQIVESVGYPKDETQKLIVEDRTAYTSISIGKWKPYADLGLLTYKNLEVAEEAEEASLPLSLVLKVIEQR